MTIDSRGQGHDRPHPFGLSQNDWRNLQYALDRMSTLAATKHDWFREPSKAEEFLLLLARVNALVPPGTIP